MLPGASLYPLLSNVLNQFRTHLIGMTGDISKMFREVGLHQGDRDLHWILHRDSAGNIVDCWMKRLTFVIITSPYLASQVLRQLAMYHGKEFVRVEKLINQSFYVDDCLTGADSVEEACELQYELNQLLSIGQMTLRKWRTSSSALLDTIPKELQEKSNLDILLSPTEQGKALGIH